MKLYVMVLLLTLSGCGTWAPSRVTGVVTGLVSHQLCSATFIAGMDTDDYYRQVVGPMASPLGSVVTYSVDHSAQIVTARLPGLRRTQASYQGTSGCTLFHNDHGVSGLGRNAFTRTVTVPVTAETSQIDTNSNNKDWSTSVNVTAAMRAALDNAFAENTTGPLRQTSAIVVLHQGQLIAERYAPGYDLHTPVHGWSATKSVMNALLGVLVHQGLLELHAPVNFEEWNKVPQDPRRAITADHLIRMTSGLDIGNSLAPGMGSVVDAAAQLLYLEDNMAAVAASAPLVSPPGQRWTYSDASTVLLSRLIRQTVESTGDTVQVFARRELFDKLGMTKVTLEVDASATPIGASHMWATPRDWARLGSLYLQDGVINGQRLLPQGWVELSASLTPGSEAFGYGAGFWTNRGDSEGARQRIALGIPSDAFMARGNLGQYVIVVPSHDLVIARFGHAFTERGDIEAIARLTREVTTGW